MHASATHAQASAVSAVAFGLGATMPLLSGCFLQDSTRRIISVALSSTAGLAVLGATGALLGGARPLLGALRVVISGMLAMGATYGIGRAVGAETVA